MKRVILLVMVWVAIAALAMPNVVEAKVGFGGKAGLNLAKVYGDDAAGADNRFGLVGGFYLDFPLSKNFAFHTEGLYSQKGAKDSEGSLSVTVKLDYFEVPLFLLVRLPQEGSTVAPMFYVGPTFGFNVKSQVSADVGGAGGSADFDNAKAVDVGIAFGGGSEVMLGKNKLVLDVRLTLGTAGAVEDVDNPGPNDLVVDDVTGIAPDWKNIVIGFLVSYGI